MRVARKSLDPPPRYAERNGDLIASTQKRSVRPEFGQQEKQTNVRATMESRDGVINP